MGQGGVKKRYEEERKFWLEEITGKRPRLYFKDKYLNKPDNLRGCDPHAMVDFSAVILEKNISNIINLGVKYRIGNITEAEKLALNMELNFLHSSKFGALSLGVRDPEKILQHIKKEIRGKIRGVELWSYNFTD